MGLAGPTDRNSVFDTPRHNDICSLSEHEHDPELELTRNLPLGFDITFEVWFYECKPLLYATLDVSAALLDISKN